MSQGICVQAMARGTPERHALADAFDLSGSCALGRCLKRFETRGPFRDPWQTARDADLVATYHPRYGHESGVGG
jgi:hypothetical protein